MSEFYKSKKARIVFKDNRVLEGSILKCDFQMNTIISNSVEYRFNKKNNKWRANK